MGKSNIRIYCRKFLFCRRLQNPMTVTQGKRKETDDERSRLPLHNGRERRLDVAVAATFQNNNLPSERARRRMKDACVFLFGRELLSGKISDPRHIGHQLMQKIEPLARQLISHVGQSRNIAARPVRLATRPSFTGSTPVAITIGIVEVAALAASAEPPAAAATITAT